MKHLMDSDWMLGWAPVGSGDYLCICDVSDVCYLDFVSRELKFPVGQGSDVTGRDHNNYIRPT